MIMHVIECWQGDRTMPHRALSGQRSPHGYFLLGHVAPRHVCIAAAKYSRIHHKGGFWKTRAQYKSTAAASSSRDGAVFKMKSACHEKHGMQTRTHVDKDMAVDFVPLVDGSWFGRNRHVAHVWMVSLNCNRWHSNGNRNANSKAQHIRRSHWLIPRHDTYCKNDQTHEPSMHMLVHCVPHYNGKNDRIRLSGTCLSSIWWGSHPNPQAIMSIVALCS